MTRDKVFISYSHQDHDFFEAFRKYLTLEVLSSSLQLWSDQEIRPSQNWHEEIQLALERTAVAVLLVSQDFLVSTYIRQDELPYLVKAREQNDIKLTCLYLRDSTVAADSLDIILDSGSTVTVNLTQYQGLNSPQKPIAAQPAADQDTMYTQAARDLQQILNPPPVSRPLSHERYELTVRLKRQDRSLLRIYLHRYSRLYEHRDPWHRPRHPSGDDLFETLFGPGETYERVLKLLFRDDLPRPIRHPVRVRIHTEDPELAELPWAQAAWNGYTLCGQGWTFELIRGANLTATPIYPDITLRTPCPVLMITSPDAPSCDVHHRALEERLHRAWPVHHEPPLWAHTWDELKSVWRRRPGMVYYYGSADGDGHTLRMRLDDGSGGVDARPVTDLATLWGSHPPQVLFCNLVEQPVAPGIAMGALDVPLIMTQHSPQATEARRAALEWFHELLETGEDTEPVWAMHQTALPTAVAWGAYSQWHTHTAPEPDKEKLARLLLDRRQQRGVSSSGVNELVHDSERRLFCLLAYGASGNLVASFAAQLHEHLRRYDRDIARVHRLPLRLPHDPSFTIDDLAFTVRRHLGLSDFDSFGTALDRRKPRGPGRARSVLLLDWGLRGAQETPVLTIEALEAWVNFCRHHFAAQCPRDLRLISCLALETPPERHATLEQAVKALHPGARDRAFRLELLPPLDVVDAIDLANFLSSSGNAACPDELLDRMPELILRHTQGHFEKTVEVLERAARSGWYTLYDELSASAAPPESGPIARGTEL
ncbi:toll/interleukin-1 receptor domain-containing protein [Candidatus Entotheonella palauensis]|uniref:toll/interleukin-1 receptor domain-containing protein n=1 Tax=Candidatus Entotheonella palauensis TaxID=93172 RepID=UPI000B7D1897|nr:toll/interleukin-1 receptor domain-containing protein [Candidatus Entotheonella palauensis]